MFARADPCETGSVEIRESAASRDAARFDRRRFGYAQSVAIRKWMPPYRDDIVSFRVPLRWGAGQVRRDSFLSQGRGGRAPDCSIPMSRNRHGIRSRDPRCVLARECRRSAGLDPSVGPDGCSAIVAPLPDGGRPTGGSVRPHLSAGLRLVPWTSRSTRDRVSPPRSAAVHGVAEVAGGSGQRRRFRDRDSVRCPAVRVSSVPARISRPGRPDPRSSFDKPLPR